MSETKWTPGPWVWVDGGNDEVYPDDPTACLLMGVSSEGFPYIDIVELGDFTVSAGNGCLIAAAPDLYEALEALPLGAFDKEMDECDAADFVDHAGEFFSAMQKARRALAKARGESIPAKPPAGGAQPTTEM